MKKVFLLLLVCVCFFSVCCGCDGSTKNAHVNALIYDDYLKLDFIKKAIPAGDYTTFNSELNLEEIKDKLDNMKLEVGTMTCDIVNDRFLVIEKLVPKDKINYYLITNIAKTAVSSSYQYHFSACSAGFSIGDFPSQTDYMVHVPHHYFVFDENSDYPLTIHADASYELTGTIQDVFDFYNKIKIYDVQRETDSIKVYVKDDAEIFGRHTKAGFVIYFEKINDKSYACYKSE